MYVQLSFQLYSTHTQWLYFPGKTKHLYLEGRKHLYEEERSTTTQGAGPSVITAQPCSAQASARRCAVIQNEP